MLKCFFNAENMRNVIQIQINNLEENINLTLICKKQLSAKTTRGYVYITIVCIIICLCVSNYDK